MSITSRTSTHGSTTLVSPSSDASIQYLSWIRQNTTEVVQSADFLHPKTEEGGDKQEEWGRGDTVFRSSWPYFEALDAFLKPHVATRESVTNLVILHCIDMCLLVAILTNYLDTKQCYHINASNNDQITQQVSR